MFNPLTPAYSNHHLGNSPSPVLTGLSVSNNNSPRSAANTASPGPEVATPSRKSSSIRGANGGRSNSTITPAAPSADQVRQRFQFLTSGGLSNGPRITNVEPALMDNVNSYAQVWDTRMPNWWKTSVISHKRCAYARAHHVALNKAPTTSENPDVACKNCTNNWHPCVLLAADGPIVMPLAADKSEDSALPTGFNYYIRAKKKV
jgi:hypothetical protein